MQNTGLKNQPTAMQNFFWFCSGADIDLLAECRSDWRKFTAIGVFVCVVALMATVSGTFFLTESFQLPVYLAIFGGLAWGAIIYCVDRVMLAFYQKGKGEWVRILPRLILSLLISIVINEPMFVRVLRGEIEAKMYSEVQTVIDETRSDSHLMPRKTALEKEISELRDREKSLRAIKDEAEQNMERERGGVKSDNTTGNLGEGSVYAIKKKIFENAKNNYEAEGIKNTELLNIKLQELLKVDADITKEADDKLGIENKANGFWRRHEIMFSMMATKPIMIIVFLISSLVLLGIETLPLTQKFLAKKSKYDFLLEKKDMLAEQEAETWFNQSLQKLHDKYLNDTAVRTRVNDFIANGNPARTPEEQRLADIRHLDIIREQSGEILETDTFLPGQPITVEVVGNPQLTVQMTIPADLETKATFEQFRDQIDAIQKEASKDVKSELKLTGAVNSDDKEIDRSLLPLIAQLNRDRILRLRFAV